MTDDGPAEHYIKVIFWFILRIAVAGIFLLIVWGLISFMDQQ